MLIDSHAHLNFKAFDADLFQVASRCAEKKMKVINVGSQLATSKRAVELASEYPNFFAAVGIHPIHLGEQERDENEAEDNNEFLELPLPEIFEKVSELAKEKKVVAIGETGLDYFRIKNINDNAISQREYFLNHLDLAEKNNLPVILHCRGEANNPEAVYEEILEIIKKHDEANPPSLKLRRARGVAHCFGANLEIAKKFIDLGFYIGITGIITFGKKAAILEEVVKGVSLENLLIETDCPYLAPEPHRGERNEPIYVELVARKIAELKRVEKEEVIEATGRNAEKLFGI